MQTQTITKSLRDFSSYSLTIQILLSLAFACLTGIAAQIRIPLPFTPVPITLQTLAVTSSAIFLGWRMALLSQVIYVVLGMAGLGWFANFSGGADVIFGATGGYLVGFMIYAAVMGRYFTKDHTTNFVREFFTLEAASLLFIFIPGLVGLSLWYVYVVGKTPQITELLTVGLFPFIPGDCLKNAIAATIARQAHRHVL